MEHYAPCDRRRPICCCPPARRRGALALLSERLELEVGRARTVRSGAARQLRRAAARGGPAAERPPPGARRHARAARARAPRRRARSRRRAGYLAEELPEGPCASGSSRCWRSVRCCPAVRVRSRRAVAGGAQRRREDGRAALDRAARGGGRPRARAARTAAVRAAGARLRQRPRAHARRAARRLGLQPASGRSSTRRSRGRRAAGASRRSRRSARPGHAHRRRRRRRAARCWPRSPRPTCPGTITDLDTEFLHDLRVAVRRTRSALASCSGVLPPGWRAAARRAEAGPATHAPSRDLDVHLLEFPT